GQVFTGALAGANSPVLMGWGFTFTVPLYPRTLLKGGDSEPQHGKPGLYFLRKIWQTFPKGEKQCSRI
ncbi:MAG: hypothetical protein PHV34_21870, partial [Verrucomicrobiae bacterium]|nr:hypothetical protein [Verrucomicrobiae bacterium]